MKNFISTIFVLLFLFLLFEFISNINGKTKWSKLNNFIYIDKKSILKSEYEGWVSGWFKMYYTEENKQTPPLNKGVYYRLMRYKVYCDNDDPKILLDYYQEYDKEDNMLKEEKVYASGLSPSREAYGDIYVKALCN